MSNLYTCPQCNHSVLSESPVLVCEKCGTPLDTVVQPKDPVTPPTKKAKKPLIFTAIALVSAALLAAGGLFVWKSLDRSDAEYDAKAEKYRQALTAIESGDHKTAYALLNEVKGYKDSDTLLQDFIFLPTKGTTSTLVYDENGSVEIAAHYDEGDSTTYVCRFDDNGNLIEEDSIAVGGTNTYFYDDNGRLIREVYSSEGTRTITYTYDDSGNCIQETYLYDSWVHYTNTYTYMFDENGNCIEEKFCDENNKVLTDSHVYDDNGKLLQTTSDTRDGLITTTTYTYDDSGNLVWERFDVSEEDEYTVGYTIEYAYDERGNLLKQEKRRVDGIVELTKYTYNENDRIIREAFSRENGYVSVNEYVYENGWLVQRSIFETDENKTVYNYDYTFEPFYRPGGVPQETMDFVSFYLYELSYDLN